MGLRKSRLDSGNHAMDSKLVQQKNIRLSVKSMMFFSIAVRPNSSTVHGSSADDSTNDFNILDFVFIYVMGVVGKYYKVG